MKRRPFPAGAQRSQHPPLQLVSAIEGALLRTAGFVDSVVLLLSLVPRIAADGKTHMGCKGSTQ